MSLDFWSFFDVLRKPKPDPNIEVSVDLLYDEGLTMGTLYIGKQGTGKTSSLARNLFDYFATHPNEAIFVLDWSGSITDALFKLIVQDPQYQEILEYVVYDDLGNPDWVVPLPEFSLQYGTYDEQIARVSQNLCKLAPTLVSMNPTIGGQAIKDSAPNFFKVLTAITNEYNETWQITETRRLIYDENVLKSALKYAGNKIPSSKSWMQYQFLNVGNRERDLKTNAVVGMLGAVESDEIRARIGYYRPGWTPKEAIDKGLLVIIDGARLISREATQHYLFMQAYSLIMQEINKRRPGNPDDKPVSLVMDEVYSLLRIPSMAPEISQLSPQYRSRKLQLYIVLQELAQMSDDLRPHIWSLGNIVSFAISNHEEAYELAQQLFRYDPYQIKIAPIREGQHPMMESDRGQYLEIANWIQRLGHRQCILRRHISEKLLEEKVQFVRQTMDTPQTRMYIPIDQAKQYLLEKRGVRVRDALKEINSRSLKADTEQRPEL